MKRQSTQQDAPGRQSTGPRVGIMVEFHRPYPHHQKINQGIIRYAQEHRWLFVQAPFADEELLADPKAYDGVIARANSRLLDAAEKAGVPVVNVWNSSPVLEKVPSVLLDAKEIGRQAAEHLMARGLERFAFLRYHGDRFGLNMLHGFEQRIQQDNYSCKTLCISRNLYDSYESWRHTRQDITEWMSRWHVPVGLGVSHDELGRMMVDMCHQRQWTIPYDVAIIGSGNHPMYCMSPEPTLSTIDPDYENVGYQAASLLDKLMAGQQPPDQPILVPPSELIARQSTDVMAVADDLLSRALRFIAEHSQYPIKVNDVARAVGVTRRTLERRFHSKLGCTIAEQITQMRMNRFKRLLVETSDSLKTLAGRCGFSSLNHLYTVFVRREGCSPSQYRKALQKGGVGGNGQKPGGEKTEPAEPASPQKVGR